MRMISPKLGLALGALALSFPASAQVAAPTYKGPVGNEDGLGVITIGGQNIATSLVSVGTSAVPVVAARARQSVDITVDGAVKCYLGPAGVTTATGFPLQAVAGATKSIPSSAAVYAVCASTVNVGAMEHF